jgi:hypothetical protein
LHRVLDGHNLVVAGPPEAFHDLHLSHCFHL